MDRDADRPRLIGYGPRDSLADPPDGVGAEFVALMVIETLHRFHQPHISFLYQIQKGHAATGSVLLNHTDHKPQIGMNHLFLCRFIPPLHCLCKFQLFFRGKQREFAYFF